jgi:hypothetical protein
MEQAIFTFPIGAYELQDNSKDCQLFLNELTNLQSSHLQIFKLLPLLHPIIKPAERIHFNCIFIKKIAGEA